MKFFDKSNKMYETELLLMSKPNWIVPVIDRTTLPILSTGLCWFGVREDITLLVLLASALCGFLWLLAVPDLLRAFANRYALSEEFVFCKVNNFPKICGRIKLSDITTATIRRSYMDKVLGTASVILSNSNEEVPVAYVCCGEPTHDTLSSIVLLHLDNWQEWVQALRLRGVMEVS